jgi:hypothetical protein
MTNSLIVAHVWANTSFGKIEPRPGLPRCVSLTGWALLLDHELCEARTLQLRAISRGEEPPSLSQFQARLAPLATLGEEAELVFSRPLYAVRLPRRNQPRAIHHQQAESGTAISNQYCRPFEKNTKNGYPNPSPIMDSRSQWESTKGAILEGKGDRGCPRASLLPPL